MQGNLDDYMRFASSSSPSPSNEDKLSHSLLEGHVPPTRSIPSSSIRIGGTIYSTRTSTYVPTSSSRTSSSSGTCFILTDQLDGEMDWKLRVAVPATQIMPSDYEFLNLDVEIYGASLKNDCTAYLFHTPPIPAADAPSKDIHTYIGIFTINTLPRVSSNEVPVVQSIDGRAALSREYTVGEHCACCGLRYWLCGLYIGSETRGDEHEPSTDEIGLLDTEISQLARMSRTQLCRGQRVLVV